jgi:beta-mannosidase
LRHGVEHYRRSEFCRGSLIWQLNDCWPVQSWAILDSDGNYKALAYELRRLYADLMLSIERQNENVKVWAVNHGSTDAEIQVTLRAIHLSTGEVLNEWTSPNTQHLTPNTILQALEANLSGLAVPDTILFAAADRRAATWQLLSEPKNSRFAPPEDLIFSTSEEGYLTLRLKKPVVDLMLTDEGDPSPFYDNFITSPGGFIHIRLNGTPNTIEARSLAGEHRVKVTRGAL